MIGNVKAYLTDTLTIKRYTEGTDAYGNPGATWATAGTVSGRVRPLSGAEVFAGGQTTARGSHRAYMIPPVDVKTEDRLEFEGKTYAVNYVYDVMNFGRVLQVDLELIG